MTRRLGRTGGSGERPAIRLDDNVESYDVLRDGRSAEGRIQQVRLDHIEASPFQVRRVFPEREIEELAASIRTNGLIHEPKGRPHPTKPGWVELMPGEMRVRALKRLVETGEGEGVLARDAAGEWLIPIKIEAVEDDRAEAIVLSENLDRTDLSAWEWSLAWQQRRESLKRRNQPAGVRDVASSLGKKYQTVGEYLRVADSITLEVLMAAGVVNGSEADHKRMALLPLASLLRIARAADSGAPLGAESLLQELKRAGDSVAMAQLSEIKARAQARRLEQSGFQINIRQPLGEIAPRQAARYLARMTPALSVLVDRASADLERGEAAELASSLETLVARLRARAS